MEKIIQLQYISVCDKVSKELESYLGLNDKDLTQFIVELCKNSKDQGQFEQNLQENEADFPKDLVTKLYTLIKKMLPNGQSLSQQQQQQQQNQDEQNEGDDMGENELDEETGQKKRNLAKLRKEFGGLALPDKSVYDLIDLDKLDQGGDDQGQNKDTKNDDKKQQQRKSRSRSDDSRKKKSKKSKKSHRQQSRSRSRSKKRSSRSRSRSKNVEQQNRDRVQIEINGIYDGIVTKVNDYGAFVQIKGTRSEGLLHISEMQSDKRINNALQVLKRNDLVKVKVQYIVGNKIKLSMKEVDQETGEIKQKNISQQQSQLQKYNEELQPVQVNGDFYGGLTGVRLETDIQKKKRKKKDDENDQWEMSRLQYHSYKGITQKMEIDLDEEISDGDDMAIELSEKEPLFLKGQTLKGGVILSPVRVVKNPEGTLSREALNAQQYAKERREMRDQQHRALVNQMQAENAGASWDDPNATDRKLNEDVRLAAQYRLQQTPQNTYMNEYKKDLMFRQNRQLSRSILSIKEQKQSLPIYEFKSKLIDAIKGNRVLIVIGETGSGKTTQMTQYLLEAGFARGKKKICCTQPRRVAAMSVAKRVAEEMGVVCGEEVGFTIRFEDCTTPNTIIKYCTDGMLLREALLDPLLNQYSVVMLDEAHERNVNTDVLFGLLKKVVQKRKDFTLIVTSATLDAEKFSQYFFDCHIFRIPGRTFPVDIQYSVKPETDYLESSLQVVMQIHLQEPEGDILLFLTGQEEIDNACQVLFDRMQKLGPEAPELIILPIYSSLPSELQQRIFEATPKGKRKVVIATNIAEASITIDGIYYVIDPGFSKIKMFNPTLGHDILSVVPISQASARQRAGRAGRTGPGKCYRLYTEEAFKTEMLPTSVPEIQRTNLTNTILTLKAMGINDLLNFDFMDPPPVQTLINSLEQLYSLGALDDEGMLTRMGLKMAELPLQPSESKMLMTAVDLGCSEEICTIISMLQVHNVFYRPKENAETADQKRAKFNDPDGDFLTILNVYEAWKANNYSNIWCSQNYIDSKNMNRALDVRKQLVQILERYKFGLISCKKDTSKLRKAITAGFFFNAAKKDPQEGYKTIVDNHTVYIHPSSSLFNRQPEWVVYGELVLTSKEYMRNVCSIEPKWLIDVAPNFFQFSTIQQLNNRKRQTRLEPLQARYGQDQNAWRLSRR